MIPPDTLDFVIVTAEHNALDIADFLPLRYALAYRGIACLARTHSRESEMEEWLFSNQPTLTPELVKQAARDVGQVTDFEAKYTPTLDLVKSDIAFGKTLGVSATPTIFINGVKIAGVLAPQYFDQAIAYELQHATPAK